MFKKVIICTRCDGKGYVSNGNSIGNCDCIWCVKHNDGPIFPGFLTRKRANSLWVKFREYAIDGKIFEEDKNNKGKTIKETFFEFVIYYSNFEKNKKYYYPNFCNGKPYIAHSKEEADKLMSFIKSKEKLMKLEDARKILFEGIMNVEKHIYCD